MSKLQINALDGRVLLPITAQNDPSPADAFTDYLMQQFPGTDWRSLYEEYEIYLAGFWCTKGSQNHLILAITCEGPEDIAFASPLQFARAAELRMQELGARIQPNFWMSNVPSYWVDAITAEYEGYTVVAWCYVDIPISAVAAASDDLKVVCVAAIGRFTIEKTINGQATFVEGTRAGVFHSWPDVILRSATYPAGLSSVGSSLMLPKYDGSQGLLIPL